MNFVYICTTKPVTVANELDQRGRNRKTWRKVPTFRFNMDSYKSSRHFQCNTGFCTREILVCFLRAEVGETGEDLNIIFDHDRL